ncbi:hypothetical protein ABFT80_19030 [Mesorhizobium sp. SB112]|uniref:hypothetical protein n=1 Tax=Mesorhizobium sp. SB112 TaxID=3151853 RepID=UPI003262E7DB
MFRFLFRLAASIALAVAVIMAVLDATRTVAASQLVLTPLATSWVTVSPETLETARAFVSEKVHPLLWDPAIVTVLKLPGFVFFAILAFLLYAVGHRPERRSGRFAADL